MVQLQAATAARTSLIGSVRVVAQPIPVGIPKFPHLSPASNAEIFSYNIGVELILSHPHLCKINHKLHLAISPLRASRLHLSFFLFSFPEGVQWMSSTSTQPPSVGQDTVEEWTGNHRIAGHIYFSVISAVAATISPTALLRHFSTGQGFPACYIGFFFFFFLPHFFLFYFFSFLLSSFFFFFLLFSSFFFFFTSFTIRTRLARAHGLPQANK